nr:choice-of-anchor L domain-containing protein [uncultured Halomonas sp.]
MSHFRDLTTLSSQETYNVGDMQPHIVVPVSDPNDPFYIVEPGDAPFGLNLDGVVNVHAYTDSTLTSYGSGTGALLSDGKHILTAAHVVDGGLEENMKVYFDLPGGRESFEIAELHLHPLYQSGNFEAGHDIALLELEHAIEFLDGYDIYRGDSEMGQSFYKSGYGQGGTAMTGAQSGFGESEVKRWGMNTYDDLPWTTSAPEGSLLYYEFEQDSYLGNAEVSSAPGDSGGPGFIELPDGSFQISSIVKGGSYEIEFGSYGLETRLSYFQEWIDSITGLEAEPAPPSEPSEPSEPTDPSTPANGAFTLYNSSTMSADDLINAMISDINGISLVSGSANYIGADNATSTFESFDFGGPVRMNNSGVLLTSGDGAPPLSNTESSYTVGHGTPGDSQFNAIAQAAFGGAGTTQDAAILEFSFTVDDPSVQSISFDLIFGSEEFPQFIDSSFVDIAAVLVNDINYGLFDGNEERPLSVIGANIEDGNLLDNGTGYPNTSYPHDTVYDIEYNGISPRLTINIPLDGSDVYDVRIGVADTGDTSLDSGLFVSNFQTSTSGAGGLLVNVTASPEGGLLTPAGPNTATLFEGGSGDDIMLGSTAADIYNLSAGGSNIVTGSAEQLNGDTVQGFDTNDKIQLQGSQITQDNLTVTMGSAILDIDTNGDGQADTTITLEGDFENAKFSVEQEGGDSLISYVEIEPSEPIGMPNVDRASSLITEFGNQIGLSIDNFDRDVVVSRLLKELDANRSIEDFDIIVSMDRVIRNDFREVRDLIGDQGIEDALSSIRADSPELFVPAATDLFGL